MNRIIYNILMICLGWFLGGPFGALFMFFTSLFFSLTDSHKKKNAHNTTFEEFFDFWEDTHSNGTYENSRNNQDYGYGQYHGSEYQYYSKNDSLLDAYKKIGTDNNASNDEIRKAYRKACLSHHPDKFSTASKEVQKSEEEKFKEVQDAYNMIKKERDIK